MGADPTLTNVVGARVPIVRTGRTILDRRVGAVTLRVTLVKGARIPIIRTRRPHRVVIGLANPALTGIRIVTVTAARITAGSALVVRKHQIAVAVGTGGITLQLRTRVPARRTDHRSADTAPAYAGIVRARITIRAGIGVIRGEQATGHRVTV